MSERAHDNSLSAFSADAKSLSADRPPYESPRISGISHPDTSSPASRIVEVPTYVHPKAPCRRVMHHFVPRPFPPPALANVPLEYIVDQLHSLAPHYWSKPETADCTIVVPLDALYRTRTEQVSRSSGSTPEPFFQPTSPQYEQSNASQNVEPSLRPAPRMVMKLHIDYLSAQSTLLRALFSGVSPLEVQSHPSSSSNLSLSFPFRENSPDPSLSSQTRPRSTIQQLPRVLPSAPNHPTIYLPVPDPSSFRLLVHYLYFGSTTFIEDALDDGSVSWEGLARNVEFLGLGVEIKVFLGRWYGRWRRGRQEPRDYDDSDSDESYEGSDEEDDLDYYERGSTATSLTSNPEDEAAIEADFKLTGLDTPRGRDRSTRRLGHAQSDPGLHVSRPPRRTHTALNTPRGRSG